MMRLAFLLAFLAFPALAENEMIDTLWGEPIKIDPAKPPNGIQMMQILLEKGGAIRLRETPCGDNGRPDDPKLDKRTLLHILATNLGNGLIERNRKMSLIGQCKADQFEFHDGVKDIWTCDLNAITTTKKGSYIANGDLHFGITRDTWAIIPEAFMCL